jgi:hypothetical protein
MTPRGSAGPPYSDYLQPHERRLSKGDLLFASDGLAAAFHSVPPGPDLTSERLPAVPGRGTAVQT